MSDLNNSGNSAPVVDKLPVNCEKPAITVYYRNLSRAGEGVLRSDCPFCVDGTLMLLRHQTTGKIVKYDRCIGCGQAVVYADLDQAFPSADENKETMYERTAGFPCRVCGTTVMPSHQGNALVGYHCPSCNEDFMP